MQGEGRGGVKGHHRSGLELLSLSAMWPTSPPLQKGPCSLVFLSLQGDFYSSPLERRLRLILPPLFPLGGALSDEVVEVWHLLNKFPCWVRERGSQGCPLCLPFPFRHAC